MLRELVEKVGPRRFERACEWAWATAARTGRSAGTHDPDSRWPDDVVGVPHELADEIWDEGAASWSDRIALAFELYRAMPCYATLMYMDDYFSDWDEAERELFWKQYRVLLSHDDERVANPVAYSLWCHYLEDPASVEEAWRTLAAPGALSDLGLRRLLEASGPVPYDLKLPVYERLLPERHWHPHLFRSLLASAFDVYGKIDPRRARQLLRKLALPRHTEGLEELISRLDALAERAKRRRSRDRKTRRPHRPRRA